MLIRITVIETKRILQFSAKCSPAQEVSTFRSFQSDQHHVIRYNSVKRVYIVRSYTHVKPDVVAVRKDDPRLERKFTVGQDTCLCY